jgi:hypothetical protein
MEPYPSVGGRGIKLLPVNGRAIRRNRCGRGHASPNGTFGFSMTFDPIKPVPPMTTIFMVYPPLSTSRDL